MVSVLIGSRRRKTEAEEIAIEAPETRLYRFFLNLYSTPTEIPKLMSVWVALVP
jgi:hypothetical protein